MIFSAPQIKDMLFILKKYELIFIASQLGLGFLTEEDIKTLTSSGININQYTNKKGIVEHAFLFGILAEAIGSNRAKNMSYSQFQKFLKSGNFIPLTKEEEFALDFVKNRAYNDITNLGNRMRSSLSNSVLRNNQQQSLLVQKIIKKKVIKSIELRTGATKLASELANVSKDWEVDWLRIAHYITHESYNTGRSQSILKEHGSESEVYFDVYEGSCEKCKELYLTDPEDENSLPIVFKLVDIIQNGNNIGRKKNDWLATISPIHPYCRCTINYKPEGFDWNPDLRSFSKPIKKVFSKLNNVKLNIKISK